MTETLLELFSSGKSPIWDVAHKKAKIVFKLNVPTNQDEIVTTPG